MNIHSVSTFWKAPLALIGVAIFLPVAAASDVPESYQVVDGVAIYVGVMPAEVIQGHPKEHTEGKKMHGGVPTKGHRDHLVVALFDKASGKRIENATVTGSVMELGLREQNKKLEAMKIADTITYGNYFDMPNNNTYHIKLMINVPGVSHVIKAKFTHRHFDD